ncbi:MAG TPA: hypothetical protein VLA49_18985 [Anaerolineales bacterium]|nr:hypothetical protein [Anaerolineales bacterium]
MRIKKVAYTILIIALALSVMAPGLNNPGFHSLKQGQTTSFTAGRAGVAFTQSSFSGTVKVTRKSTSKAPGEEKPKFTQNLLDVRLTDRDGNTITHVLGSVYVFFKVRQKDIRLWEQGKLSIYFFDTWTQEWTTCYTFAVRNGSISNLACRVRVFGLYGLASK